VVWELSKSEAALGVVGMFGALPLLLLGPFAGVWADRLDRRRLLIATQTTAMVLAFILAFLVQTQLVQLWHVYILAMLLGTVTAIDLPAQQAFLGDLAGMEQVRRAVNLNNVIVQVSRMLGPAAAGLVIARLGTATAFWLNGASFIAVIGSLLAVGAHHVRTGGGRVAGGFTEALRYLKVRPRLQDLFIFVTLFTFFGFPIIQILPSVADEVLHGNAQTLGLLMGASGAGALIGSLVLVPIAQTFRRPGVVVSLTVLWVGAWFGAISFATSLPFGIFTIFMGSLGAPIIITMTMGLLQVLVPMEMRARLLSLFVMTTFGAQPIASLLVGLSAQNFGTPLAIRINGALMLFGVLALNVLRSDLRHWELAHEPAFRASQPSAEAAGSAPESPLRASENPLAGD
jgi:MFS family permease